MYSGCDRPIHQYPMRFHVGRTGCNTLSTLKPVSESMPEQPIQNPCYRQLGNQVIEGVKCVFMSGSTTMTGTLVSITRLTNTCTLAEFTTQTGNTFTWEAHENSTDRVY